MANSPKVEVSPAVIKWVVEEGGLEIPKVASRLGVPESAVRGWMRERRRISVAKLEKLSAYARRPLAVFLLARPPARQPTPDYRGLPPSKSGFTRDAAFAIRLARYLRGAAGEMMESCGQDASPDVRPGVTVRHSPERIASQERPRLGLDAPRRAAGPGDPARRFAILRDAVESLNVPVFQQRADPEEMRGLSLTGGRPCAVLINSCGSPAAKRSALMHEYGHILLGKGGVCAMPPGGGAPPAVRAVESWCDRFAAFALMPRAEFCAEYERQEGEGEEAIARLSRRFAAGRPAVAMHALDLGLATRATVDRALERKDAPPKSRGPSPPARCVGERGRKFVSLVLESRRARTISSRDAAVYLGVDLVHAQALREILKETARPVLARNRRSRESARAPPKE